MNSPQNKQSDNGGNTRNVSSSRAASTADRTGSHTDASEHQGTPDDRASGAVGGGMPMSPAGNHQSADRKMDDDTGLSNTANRVPSEPDQDKRQERQSNVGRRSDGTPD